MPFDRDASASSERPGKFADLYEMRTVQETILELARSQQVIAATLQKADSGTSDPPSVKAVDEFRERLRMTPPGGAEFGKTEVFYLNIKDPNRERALRLVAELCQQLDLRLRELRSDQARGLIIETKAQLNAAEQLLAAETERLANFEAEVGADLGELRTLNSSWSGQSDLRQKHVALEADCRRFKEQVRETRQLLDLLSPRERRRREFGRAAEQPAHGPAGTSATEGWFGQCSIADGPVAGRAVGGPSARAGCGRGGSPHAPRPR